MQKFKFGGKKNEAPQKRSKYVDHSLKFVEQVNQLGLEKTRIGRFLAMLEGRFKVKRLTILFFFSLLLAFFLTFEIEVPYNFEVGQVAKVTINSPVSFEMVDQVTTEEKRLKAEMSVPSFFDFDPTVSDRISGNIFKGFRAMRSHVRQVTWSRRSVDEIFKEFYQYKSEFESHLGVSVSDFLYDWLITNKFNPRVENILIRIIEGWLENRVADSPDRFIPPSQNNLIVRVVSKSTNGREFLLEKSDVWDMQNPERFQIKDVKGVDSFSLEDQDHLLKLARLLVFPNLTPNKQETSLRRQKARDGVLPILISVRKNQPIITEGTLIQNSQMALIREIQLLKSDRRKDFVSIMLTMLFVTLILVFFSYLRRFSLNKVKVESKDLYVMGVTALGVVMLTKFFLFVTDAAFVSRLSHWLPPSTFMYLAPVASAPMLVGLLINSGEIVWLFTAFLSVALGIMVEMNFSLMLVSFAGGIAGARGVYGCKKRNDIYFAGVRTGLVNAIMICCVVTISEMDQPGLFRELFWAVPAGFFSGIASSLVAMMLIPLLESLFNYTTDVKLLELSNLNHPLLKEMIVKAPGTYHHSMMVGSMVEAAAEEIGANPLLGKVMCYYHDIGKMEHSAYFIENQKPGHNPHDFISPYMSRTILVAHVKDGVELGLRYKLGKPIIDGVLQHHGTTVISFFYNKALEQQDDSEVEMAEEEFRYPGPKPQFREAALCMLADSIEAAARSLDEPTPMRLQNIVKNIIQRKFMDGQLDECNLTLKDLTRVETAFIRILLGIYHQRIDYPKSAGGMGEVKSRLGPKGPATA